MDYIDIYRAWTDKRNKGWELLRCPYCHFAHRQSGQPKLYFHPKDNHFFCFECGASGKFNNLQAQMRAHKIKSIETLKMRRYNDEL